MNRPVVSSKPDRTLAMLLALQMTLGWISVSFTHKGWPWLLPGTILLLSGMVIKQTYPLVWQRAKKIHKLLLLAACISITGFIESVFHTFSLTTLHLISTLVVSGFYFYPLLLWGIGAVYAASLIFVPVHASASISGTLVAVVATLLVLIILYSLDQMISIYREELMRIRKAERDEQYERMGKHQHLATIGQIAASIAHDIRNPLTSIQGFIQLIERQERRESYQEYYRIIRSEITRIDSLIREVLLLSKSHTLDMEKWERVDLPDLFQRLLILLEPDSIRNNIKVELNLEGSPAIMGSDEKLQQVFLNLIRNAFEAVKEQGEVLIALSEANGNAFVRIKDSGPGIPENKLETIFMPFFTTKTEGTGLGLSICQSIVKAYGGNITVRNSTDGGAEFTVTLPLYPKLNHELEPEKVPTAILR